MRKPGFLIFLYFWLASHATAQTAYLNRPDLMAIADSCLRYTYGCSFSQARMFQRSLQRKTPEHPAPPFLEALIVYWEHFPLGAEDPAKDQFIELMDRSITRAIPLIENKSTHTEGVFFDMFGRAFKAMFWADNGKPAKIIPDLRVMYNHAIEGFTLKEQLSEFYFSTGLYNYYVEAYPEAHPVYKPLVSFMQKGNKELGLLQLNHAINYTVFLRVESLLFMSLIQLNYENDLNSAAIYAERLHREYPANILYQGLLAMILLHQHRFRAARDLLLSIEDQDDPYSVVIRTMISGYLAEKLQENELLAGKKYQELVEKAREIGPMADTFTAVGYMGLSRLYRRKGLNMEANRYERKASNFTKYRFVLDEK